LGYEAGEGVATGFEFRNFPGAFCGAEDLKEIAVGEDFAKVGKGAVLVDAELGATGEGDLGLFGGV
jgi:hypothetical protein